VQLKKGQQVRIKTPNVLAEVIGPRTGDIGTPDEGKLYRVRISAQELYYRTEDLEPVENAQPQQATKRLDRTSAEWPKELERFIGIAQQLKVNPNDSQAQKQLADSWERIGIIY
jgi:hypothetical protein